MIEEIILSKEEKETIIRIQEDSTYRERSLLRLIDKQNKIINLIAEDYSEFQKNKSKIGEITETKYGILDRVCKFL